VTTVCVAHIKAAPEYIEFLRQAFRSPDLAMALTPYGHAMLVTVPDSGLKSIDAWNNAETAVRNILGSLNAFANLVGPIEIVAPVSAVAEDGKAETTHAVLSGTVRIYSKEGRERLTELAMNGTDTVLSRILKLARQHEDVDRALGLLHDRDPSWSDIYLIMEIIEMNLRTSDTYNGKDWVAIIAQGWLPAATVGAVKRNAGYHRHAKLKFHPPNPRLSLSEAQRHCKQVVRDWLDTLATR
jgi:hypothetical protein